MRVCVDIIGMCMFASECISTTMAPIETKPNMYAHVVPWMPQQEFHKFGEHSKLRKMCFIKCEFRPFFYMFFKDFLNYGSKDIV